MQFAKGTPEGRVTRRTPSAVLPTRKDMESKLDDCHTQRNKSQPVSERKALSPAPTSGQRLAHRASAPYSVGLGLVLKKGRKGNEERRQQRRKHPPNQKGAKKERKKPEDVNAAKQTAAIRAKTIHPEATQRTNSAPNQEQQPEHEITLKKES